MFCPVCKKPIDLSGADTKTGETAFGAREVDPTKGTRQFHDGEWYYFDKLMCRTKFNLSPARYLAGKSD